MLIKENEAINPYGCLMLNLHITGWDRLHAAIDPNDIYDKPGFGLEKEPHITILYGFHPEVKYQDIRTDIYKIKYDIPVKLIGLSHFENVGYNNDSGFDVVKFDVESPILYKLNKYFRKYPHTNTRSEYHPHLTVAYIKQGRAEKYNRIQIKPIILRSQVFSFGEAENGSKYVWGNDKHIPVRTNQADFMPHPGMHL